MSTNDDNKASNNAVSFQCDPLFTFSAMNSARQTQQQQAIPTVNDGPVPAISLNTAPQANPFPNAWSADPSNPTLTVGPGVAPQQANLNPQQLQALIQQAQVHYYPFVHVPQQKEQQQQQQTQNIPIIQHTSNPNTVPADTPGVAGSEVLPTIVTGPNGEQIILSSSAGASLFEPQELQPQSQTQTQLVTQAQPQPQMVTQYAPPQQQIQPHQILTYNQGIPILTTPSTTPVGNSVAAITTATGKRKSDMVQNTGDLNSSPVKKANNKDNGKDGFCSVVSLSSFPQVVMSDPSHNNQIQNQAPKQERQRRGKASNINIADKNLTPEERRRHERNVREQERSHKISQQIKELRNVLNESKVPFKPNKFSILLSVADYIKRLQTRATLLDGEHRKLINTIRETNELLNSPDNPIARRPQEPGNVGNDADLIFVEGLNYKALFQQCTNALGIAALDGRFLVCNRQFESISGICKDQSLFNVLEKEASHEMIKIMGSVLKKKEKSNEQGNEKSEKDTDDIKDLGYWSGSLVGCDKNLRINITLTRTPGGVPKYFNCAITSMSSQ